MLSSQKSTNVRQMPIGLLQGASRALCAVAPGVSTRLALELFTTPRRFERPEREARVLASGQRFRFVSEVGVLAGAAWGAGPAVMLVHGWEGRGTQLGAFVEPLVERGFRVVTFDGPAHGDSPGRTAAPRDLAAAIRGLDRWVGGTHAVIAHSMGAIATGIALQDGLHVERAVLMAPGHPVEATLALGRALDLPPSVLARFQAQVARRAGTSWAAIEAGAFFRHPEIPARIYHDRGDREVALATAERVRDQWPGAELVVTAGLGHRRILRDPEVVLGAVDWLGPPPDHPAEPAWQSFLRMDGAPLELE